MKQEKVKSYTEQKIEDSESRKKVQVLPRANTIFDNGKHAEIKTTMSAENVQKGSKDMALINDDVDLNKLFSSELGGDNDILKELFTYENIKTKTSLSKNDISIISRLEIQSHMTQNKFLKAILVELQILRVSENRAGRGEFVQAFGGVQQQAKSGMIENIGKIFKDKV